MLDTTIKSNSLQYGRMPGVIAREGKILFRTVVREGDACSLLLFEKGASVPKKTVPMKRVGNTRVFYAELSEKEAKYRSYLYEDAWGTFTDNYATELNGREKFGVHGTTTAVIPKSSVVSEKMAGEGCPAFSSLIFYKLHVRGFTKSASSGVTHKGTFAGLTEKIPYLKELGINAVLLMPVYEFEECIQPVPDYGMLPQKTMEEYEKRYGSEFIEAQKQYAKETTEHFCAEKVNYWGYTRDNYYFAPKASYAAKPAHAREELQEMVDALHQAGISVFFEFFFGEDTTQLLILDCLRYWTENFYADGFRLIGSHLPMKLILEDPYLSGVRFLITEQEGVLSDGDFAHRRVALYNEEFRNIARRFVKGDENMTGSFVGALCSDFPNAARMNFIADQNGFSLYDLYAYDRKHNEENGEENRDGENYNYSWNCGAEGETNKKKILQQRSRLRKNALCCTLLSRSVPLLFAGDEFGHSKKGNNNAYCQDNEVSWLNWRLNKEKREQLEFVKKLIAFRKAHEAHNGGRLVRTEDYKGYGLPEVSYHGVSLWKPDFAPYSRCVSVLFHGNYFEDETKEDIFLIFNMHWEEHSFALPQSNEDAQWQIMLDTSGQAKLQPEEDLRAYAVTADPSLEKMICQVMARSVVVLVRKLPQ